jgi:putative ABC transport system permease protein
MANEQSVVAPVWVSFRAWFEGTWQDVIYGGRMLVANPGFTSVAILSLAVGIGANCAIFSFADALLLRPLPVARPGELLTIGSKQAVEAFGASGISSSYRDYVDLRERTRSFASVAAFGYVTAGVTADPKVLPRLRMGMVVSDNFFGVMGVQPDRGRMFRPEEHAVPGRDAVVVLSHDLWERQFAADPSVLGHTVLIRSVEFTIIGVAPEQFTGLSPVLRAEFFVPLMMWPRLVGTPQFQPLDARDARQLNLKGRLNPGVSMQAAQAELTVIARDLERAYPDTNKNRGLTVRTELQTRMDSDPPDTTLIAMLSTLAFAVLLVACANVAGLMTSRSPARAREMALRLAIGAGRARLVRQLLTESLLIALGGGVLGLSVGYAGMMLFRQIQIPTELPIQLAFELDRRALLVSLAVSVASAVLFGVVPAIQAARTDLNAVMKASESTAPGSRRRWGRSLLVGGQVAISVILLALAVFMYGGFRAQLIAGPGYRTDHLLIMRFDPSLVSYSEEQSRQFFKKLTDSARAVPGVRRIALTSSIPMLTDTLGTSAVVPEGFQFPAGKDNANVFSASVDEHYFDAMGIALVSGRNFRENDAAGAPRVAVVNEQFAKHYWPGQDPIGKRIQIADRPAALGVTADGGARVWAEVVGLAKMSKYLFVAETPTDFVYFAYRQQPPQPMAMLAQSAGDPAALTAPLRAIVQGLDPNLPIFTVRTMEEVFRMRAITVFNVLIGLVGTMGLMGLGLAIVGLYGLLAYAVSRRTKEIGIRMAMGAERSTVLRMVLRQAFVLTLAGLAVGLIASVGVDRLMRAAFPTGDNAFRPMALLVVAPFVMAVAFAAAYIPARRASRLDPMKALRYD